MKKFLLLLVVLLSLSPAVASADAGGAEQGYVDSECFSFNCNCEPGGRAVFGLKPDVTSVSECEAVCDEAALGLLSYSNSSDEEKMNSVDGQFQCLNEFGAVIKEIMPPEAISTLEEKRAPFFPKLNVPIPGFDPEGSIVVDEEGDQQSNLLGAYVKAIYAYLLLAASVVAITMLMIAGLQYATARGDSGQVTKAKQRIQNAIVGIILLLLAYNIAFLVNPATVEFDPLTIQGIDKIEAFPAEGEDINITPRSDLTGGTKRVAGAEHMIASSDILVADDVLPQLQIAVDVFWEKTKKNVFIASGTRDLVKQSTLYYNNCIARGGSCSVPTCNPAAGYSINTTGQSPAAIINLIVANAKYGNCPHTSGVAIDAWCDDGGGNYIHDPACQQELIKAMTDNGFCRLKSEVWHFELDTKKVSTACSTSENGINYTSRTAGAKYPPNSCARWDFKEHECVLEKAE